MQTISKHSWYNKYAHVFRNNGKIVRGQIKDLIFDEHTILLKVVFNDKNQQKNKHVSPITIATLQVLWLNVDIVSDVELPDDMSFCVPPECDELSTSFDITDVEVNRSLTGSQKHALDGLKLDLKHILSLTNHNQL